MMPQHVTWHPIVDDCQLSCKYRRNGKSAELGPKTWSGKRAAWPPAANGTLALQPICTLRAPNKTKSVILSAAKNLLAEARSRTGKKILRCAQNDRVLFC